MADTRARTERQALVNLRPYQEEARISIYNAWAMGNLNALCVASTGSGKTEIGLATMDNAAGRERVLWVAHREELIFQPYERAVAHWLGLGRPGIVMADRNECAADFIIATIQTLTSNGRLDEILSHGSITHLVTDEAHHSAADSYRTLYARLRADNPRMYHLGLTATPKRTDTDNLPFDVVAYRITLKSLIKQGYLVPFKAIGVSLPVSLAGVKESADGWQDEAAGEILSAANAEEIVVETWAKQAAGRPTIAFTASVSQAYSLAQRFREGGFSFEAIDGNTPKEKRRDVLYRFKHGNLQGVINCAVLTEGFDAPEASCLVQVRPTKSDLVYVQMAGRVLRTAPGKDDALILDFVPAAARDMVMAGDLLGKPREQRKAEQKLRDDGIIGAFGIDREGNGIDGDPDDVLLQVLDYLSASQLSWYLEGNLATATVAEKSALAIVLPDEAALVRLEKANALKEAGKWSSAWDGEYARVLRAASFSLMHIADHVVEKLGEFESWDDASAAADDWVDAHGVNVLSRRAAAWRKEAASEKQEALLKRISVWEHLPHHDKGTAAKALTHYFTAQTLHKQS